MPFVVASEKKNQKKIKKMTHNPKGGGRWRRGGKGCPPRLLAGLICTNIA